MTVDEIIAAAEQLTEPDKARLIQSLEERFGDGYSDELIDEIRESERQFARGNYAVVTPEELLRELGS